VSYILEALKKLEQKRRREEGGLLLSEHHAGTRPKRQPLWLALIAIALIFNAGLLMWWLRPWHRAEPERKAAQSYMAVKRQPPQEPVSEAAESRTRETTTPAPSYEAHQRPVEVAAAGHNEIPVMPRPAAERQSSLPAVTKASAPSPAQQPVDIGQLSPALKQALPDLTISGHFFDPNPASRIVIIGGRTFHEGQTPAPGLTLEQITRNGAVFSYQGIRFRKGIF
jgi:general secretion pathway protein B